MKDIQVENLSSLLWTLAWPERTHFPTTLMLFPCPRDQGDLGESVCVFVGAADATPDSFIAMNRKSVGATTGADCARFEQEEARRLHDKAKDKKESLRSELTERPQMMKSGQPRHPPQTSDFYLGKAEIKSGSSCTGSMCLLTRRLQIQLTYSSKTRPNLKFNRNCNQIIIYHKDLK